MKKYILGIIVIIAVIFVSGCISNSDDVNNPQTLSKNGIIIKYPGSWVVANSQSNDSIASVADPSSTNGSSDLAQINVNIERREITSSLDSFHNQTYTQLFSNSDYQLIAQGNLTVGDSNALETIYTVNKNGTISQHRAVWIQKDNSVYVILFTAPQSKFESQNKNFEFILGSFKIT
ncbi:hypothetical protein MBCUT_01280 [Methanobrevibacter cuticularis]|uniref:PsbP C-terminal domain-containing protein n=1 Tax=Methanobrevibacter cuticularis TaxID=47311 RepID=A0A166FGI4_9EURY|nr:PsbP-related protein [Methanobrevibacter cuticularis]KZX17650.1 hypothetical protein MBCUT_01280 [Methanobrevibacter cuticularis]